MDEAALVARASEERTKLFQRYDRGREPGAEIDPWEDPTFEIYHQMDRYGFIHDKRLPKKINPNEAKARIIEMERVKKWLKMTSKWNDKKTIDVLHKRIYKGIPDKVRPRVWVKLLNIEKTMEENKNVYQNMLKLARQWSTEARQIDSDVNRQFREHDIYRERYSIKQKSLFNVLTAYSMYNAEVGYCQGMSGVAGVLLMYMDEEEAFWALSTLLADKKYAMHGLYIEGFPKLTRFLGHHDKIIGKFLPKLKKHFDHYNLDSILYSLKWFFVIFIERIPFSLCLRVWDIYLLDGERVVTAMAYTILRLHKNKLLKLNDMDLIVQYLQTKLHLDFGYDDDYVIKVLEQSMEELKKSKLDLPAPGQPIEFPKRPFGSFQEPNFEAKVGIRKSVFSETEKVVTETVILNREKTAQEVAESQMTVTINGSNGHLNMGNIPESEDGGSLLGSSRKSLADTSVTSTADLSVFSGGQRSQQGYDICINDSRSALSEDEDDGEGQSSPGSLSALGRTPSTMMITPVPRAISPQDIVRIYVPPAPPEELKINEDKQTSTLVESVTKEYLPNNFSISSKDSTMKHSASIVSKQKTPTNESPQDDLYDSNKNAYTNGSGSVTPMQDTSYRSEEELHRDISEIFNYSLGTTSSSRRGSLGRKSPAAMFESNVLMECSHILARQRSNQSNPSSPPENKIKLNVMSSEDLNSPTKRQEDLETRSSKLGAASKPSTSMSLDLSGVGRSRMTSFEQLAASKKKDEHLIEEPIRPINIRNKYEHNETSSPEEDENYPYFYYNNSKGNTYFQEYHSSGKKTAKYVSESNIQYKSFSATSHSATEIEYQPLNRRPNSSGNEISPFQYDQFLADDKVKPPSIKEYKRLYSASIEDDDIENNESSPSPTSKSILNTPVNETIPLLSSPSVTNKSITMQSDEYSDNNQSPTKEPLLTTITNQTFYTVDVNRMQMIKSNSAVITAPAMKNVSLSHSPSPTKQKFFLSSSSPTHPINDLNTVLPPVEIIRNVDSGGSSAGTSTSTSSIIKANNRRQSSDNSNNKNNIIKNNSSNSSISSNSSNSIYKINSPSSYSMNNNNNNNSSDTQKNGSTMTSSTGPNTILIKVNQNDKK